MPTQIALALTEIGKPLTKVSLPIPETSHLKDTEVLIKITAAGLAPLDQKFRDRNWLNISSRLPAIISGDLVGTVVANGPNISLPIGAHIFSQMLLNLANCGGLQEYTIINGLYTAVVPAGIPDEEAALLFSSAGFGLPLPGTPEAVDFDYASQKIAVVGGGSNTGKLAVQLARLAGMGTIIAIASASSAGVLKSFGATHVIARQDSDVQEQVRKIVGDNLLYVYDSFSFDDLSLGVSLLSNSKRGIFVHNGTGQASDDVLATKKMGLEDKRILGFSHLIPEFGMALWRLLPSWLETGEIRPLKYKVIDRLDADKVNHALDEYGEGRSAERYHVRM